MHALVQPKLGCKQYEADKQFSEEWSYFLFGDSFALGLKRGSKNPTVQILTQEIRLVWKNILQNSILPLCQRIPALKGITTVTYCVSVALFSIFAFGMIDTDVSNDDCVCMEEQRDSASLFSRAWSSLVNDIV